MSLQVILERKSLVALPLPKQADLPDSMWSGPLSSGSIERGGGDHEDLSFDYARVLFLHTV